MQLDAPIPDTLHLPPAPVQTTLAAVLDERMLFDAWERVRSNDGCAGIDTQSIDEFATGLLGNLQRLKAEVERREYRPQPLQALHIPKPAGGFRTLAIPSVRDRVLQTAVARTLGPPLDRNFSDSSFAYRPGRSVAMAVQRVVAHRDAGLRHVVDADIESFFDQIDHHLLIETLVRAHPVAEDLIALIQQWLAADLRETGPAPGRLLDRGLPQGSPLSPLLANLYLDKLDRTLKLHGLAFVRYADDLLVLCATAGAARGALLQLRLALAERRLTLNERKTRLTDFDTGFQFLGMRFVHRLVEPLTTAEPPEFDVTHLARLAVRGSAAHTKPAKAAPRILESIDPASTASEDEASPATAEPTIPKDVLRPSLLQTLYVGEPGVLVTKEHDRCIVSRRKEVLASVPLGQLDQIALLENALVSTALLRACAARRIAVAFSGHGGELVAIERGALADQALVAAQWRAQGNGELHMLFARQFIEGKLHNARTVLRRFTRRDGRIEIHQHLLGIDDCQYRLASAPNLATLRGLEGSAARHYFAALRTLLPEGVDFPSRSRRPPADPVNAMLSLAYAVLDHNLHTLVRLAGLNPHLGHLHSAAPGNLALVSDLIEEFRAPVVDAVVLTMWRQREVRGTDFDLDPTADLPCRMRSDARRRFVAALEAKLESHFIHPRLQQQVDFRRAMQAQVEHYKRVLLRQQVVYQPLKLR